MRKTLVVNGAEHETDLAPAERLIDTLRRRLGLTGTKVACGVGECGACTVLIDDRPVMACVTLAATVTEPVTTVEGLEAIDRELRESFAAEGGFQCGFCTPGQLMSAHAYASSCPSADEGDVRAAMNGNVCRCTGYSGIVRAVQAVTGERGS